MTAIKTVFETDDLWHPDQIPNLLVTIKKRIPNLVVNAFAVPNKLGNVERLKVQYPWIKFCIHGFEHTHFECAEWTTGKAKYLMGVAQSLGYEPVFKAPNYYMDEETARACLEMGITLVLPPGTQSEAQGGLVYPSKGVQNHVRVTSHLVEYPGSQDFITTHPWMQVVVPEEHKFISIPEVFQNEA